MDGVLDQVDARTKLIFVCSPNNPTGNLLDQNLIVDLARSFDGLLVVDEAYIQFSDSPSLIKRLNALPNLVVLQTFSKAWGLAGLRLGVSFSSSEVHGILSRIKAPYNIGTPAQHEVLAAIANVESMRMNVAALRSERAGLKPALEGFSFVEKVYPSEGNFVLVRMHDARAVYQHLLSTGIVVRDRSGISGCENCLRITIGTADENALLLKELRTYEEGFVH